MSSRWKLAGIVVAASVLLASCATAADGNGTLVNAPNADLKVQGGDSSSSFDQLVKNSLFDVEQFWKANYPSISGGKQLPPLKGGLFSIDGVKVVATKRVTPPIDKCTEQQPASVIDNAHFCEADDSVTWDRGITHLVPVIVQTYGPLVGGMIFAHEFGHAIQFRLGIFDQNLPTIDTESQADCAAGAWLGAVLKHQAPHFRTATQDDLDNALEGYLNVRDETPGTTQDISHGNGFDRLSAVADGIANGPTYCYSKNYFNRTFTERPFTTDADFADNGNMPLDSVVSTSSDNATIDDLNRFWTKASKTVKATWPAVKIKEATHPACGPSQSKSFGYCPNDNTVYFDSGFARAAYYSLPVAKISQTDASVTILKNQAADNALGTLFQIGWGFAVRDKVFHRGMADQQALTAAICYTGAYSKDINLDTDPDVNTPAKRLILLSPADLDEAVSILLNKQIMNESFGTLDTTGLDRIQAFVKGYKRGLSSC